MNVDVARSAADGLPGLPRGVVRILGDLDFRIDGELLALAFDASGQPWSVEEPGVLREWDIQSGWATNRVALSDLEMLWCFSPDARWLASASDDVTLWDVAQARLLAAVRQPAWVTALAFSPDGMVLATGHEEGRIRVWDLARGRLLGEWPGHDGPIAALTFSPDGRRLASAAEDKIIALWEVAGGRRLGQFIGHTDRIQALAWRPHSQQLVSAGWDTTARVWDTTRFEPIILLNAHADVLTALAFSPDGQWLATADSNHVVWLWDASAAKPVHQLRGHGDEVACLSFHPDSQRLLSGGRDRRMLLWDVRTGRHVFGQAEQYFETARISLSPDGRRLACVAGGPAVRIWDTDTGECATHLDLPDVRVVAYSPDGRWLATGDAHGGVRLWQDSDAPLRQAQLLGSQPGAVTALAFAPDSRQLAAGDGSDGSVHLWSLADFELTLVIPEATDNSTVETLQFCSSAPLLAVGGVDWLSTGGSDGVLSLWDLDRRQEVGLVPTGVTRLALRSDGTQLAAATLTGLVCIWQLPGQELVHELTGHSGLVACLAYDPDGEFLATGSEDGTLRLWRAVSGAPVACADLETPVRDLAFSPDGRWLYTANANTTCYVLDVPELLAAYHEQAEQADDDELD